MLQYKGSSTYQLTLDRGRGGWKKFTAMHRRIQWVSLGGHALVETARSRRRGIGPLQLKLSLVYMTANRIQIT